MRSQSAMTPTPRQRPLHIPLQDSPFDLTSKYACVLCGKKTNMCCSQCNQVFYCTIEHQRQHWKQHRSECNSHITPTNKLVDYPKIKKEEIQAHEIHKVQEQQQQKRNADKEHVQLSLDRANLRKQVVSSFATGEYEGSLLLCKKLIQKSRAIYDLSQKRPDFYDYIADELTLVKAYLKIDQVKRAREILTEDALEMESFSKRSIIHPVTTSARLSKDVFDMSPAEKEDVRNRNDNMNDIRKRCSLLALMASLFYACGDFKNCEKQYVIYVQVIEVGFSHDSLETSNCYFLVGVFYLQHKYYIKSLACFKRSLSIRLIKLGERHESVSDCWYNLGIIYKQTGKKIKAIEYLERTLQLRRELIGDVSLQVAQTLETLGKILLEDSDFKAGLVKFEECYKIRKRIISNDQHPDIIRISLLIIHLFTLVSEQVHQQMGPKRQQDMLHDISNHITNQLMDKNLNNYLNMAKSHLDLMLIEEKQKDFHKAIGVYDKNHHQNQVLDNNAKLMQNDDKFHEHEEFSHVIYDDDLDIDDSHAKKDNHHNEDSLDDPLHFLVVEKDLMSTLSLDQLLALQALYDMLKDKIDNDPSYEPLIDVIRSEFVRSLSHVQFSLLKLKNDHLFKADNHEIHHFEVSRGQSAQVLVSIAAALDAPHITQNPLLHAHLLDKHQALTNRDIAQHQQLSAFITPQTHPHIMQNDAYHPLQSAIRGTGSTIYGQPSALYHPPSTQFHQPHDPNKQFANSDPYHHFTNHDPYENESYRQSHNRGPQYHPGNQAGLSQMSGPLQVYPIINQPMHSLNNHPMNQTPQSNDMSFNNDHHNDNNYTQHVGSFQHNYNNNNNNNNNINNNNSNQSAYPNSNNTNQSGHQQHSNYSEQSTHQNNNGNFHQQNNSNPQYNNSNSQHVAIPSQMGSSQHNNSNPGGNSNNNIQTQNSMHNPPSNQQSQSRLVDAQKPSDNKLNPPQIPIIISVITPTDTSVSSSSSKAPMPPSNISRGSIMPPPPTIPIKQDLGPKSRTKQLFWDKTQADPSNTIWGENHDIKGGLKLDDLDEIFSNSPDKRSQSSYQPVKVDLISLLLDTKKLASINIMLSKFKKFTNEEIKLKIINLDAQFLNPETAMTLMQYIPEPEEMNNCRDFDGNIDHLDQPSKFFLMISKIPNYEARLRNIIFKDDLPLKLKVINSQTSLILESSDLLRSSKSFKAFLQLILEVGNKMNSGTLKGKAQGFKLSSLNQLTQMKSQKGDQTLLQYIVRKLILENRQEVLNFSDQFESFKEASIINMNDVVTNFLVLQGQQAKLEKVLNAAKQSGDREFMEAFFLFHREVTSQLQECHTNVQQAKKEWEETARFFGEDDEYFKVKTSEDFFKSVFTFNEAVRKAEKSTQLQNKFSGQSNANNPNRFN